MRKLFLFISIFITSLAFGQAGSGTRSNQTTICNPLNLSYRFCLDKPSRREAADPTMKVALKNGTEVKSL
jgi:xylan 1,4-beta-xylosidase